MNVKDKLRKFVIKTCCSYPPVAKKIYNEISSEYYVKYMGVFKDDLCIIIYIHTENRILISKMSQLIKSIAIDISSIGNYKNVEGKLVSEYGDIPKKRGVKRKINCIKPVVETIKSQPINETTKSQPIIHYVKPINNCILIHDNIHTHKTIGPSCPNSFHAIWSSTNGFWSPEMWIGPCKNIIPSERKHINKNIINELLVEQDHKCRLCKTTVFMGTYSNSDTDHIIPIRYGGKSCKSNLQILCITCHRRKTSLECKKVVTLMGESDVIWDCNNVYISNSHVYFKPETIEKSNPKDCLKYFSSRAGIFILD